ncbi:DMT family protein [Luteolibacter sp. Populi]|uniref:DMT family protein n=1 Tax=Luteolibacter sp. Populi TaxID=3230487 RepID=UPI003466DF7D
MTLLKTIALLTLSNIFMTFAWYAHLKDLREKPWIIAALVSWGIALFEYLLQVPANRIGYAGGLSAAQLKITQEVITLAVFAPFAIFYLKEKLSWNYLYAALCMAGAVFFIVRDGMPAKKAEVVAEQPAK